MAGDSPVRCASIRACIAHTTSATSRCCWRASRRPSSRTIASPAPKAARTAGADVIVMDDGFQNPSLAKDLRSWWSMAGAASATAACCPRARCGVSLDAQLARAHAVLVIGESPAPEAVICGRELARSAGVSRPACSRTRRRSTCSGQHKVFAFAGIGDPEKFFATLKRRAHRRAGAPARFPIITTIAAPRL